ncbi:TonB-dependent receptor [Sphingomonas sp.]|jgi:iron complex outermembrane receptor protein|uniref:TonB-dependent receptor n=1 Tax=Sphingomonas sp. TaxID=28214 RepID=UPI002EDA0A25
MNRTILKRRQLPTRLAARRWLACLLAGASLLPQAAWAQDATTAATTDTTTSTAPQDKVGLADIIVTAQRREESVQRVPVAVTVVSGEALQERGLVNISQIGAIAPSVTFTSGFEARDNSIRIRGIGSDNSSVGVDSSISTVVDGVVLQRPGAAFGDLIDIARIEILRGPQGTLFGKNSVAGVVNVVTNDPRFDKVEGSASALIAQDGEYRASVIYSQPISDKVAIRVAALARTLDGFVRNVFTGDNLNGGDAYSGRAKMTIRPTEGFEIKLAADYNKLNSTLGASPLFTIGTSTKVPRPQVDIGAGNDQVDNDVASFARQTNYGASLEFNLDIGDHTLTFLNALRRFRNVSNFDADNTRAAVLLQFLNTEKSKTRTHELRVTSPAGGFVDYVAGALYFDGFVSNLLDRRGYNIATIPVGAINQQTGVITPTPALVPVLAFASVDTRNIGLYGQINVHPTDKFTITGGLRYINEKNRFDFDRTTAPPLNSGYDYKDDALTGKLALAYQATSDVLAYASYATGYTGKATNSGASLTIAEFNNGPANPMTSEQYEIGLKSQFADGRVRVNLAAFRTRYEDYQATITRPSDGLRALTNAGTVGIDGVELELTAAPTQGLTISGGVTYLDARFVRTDANCYPGQTAALGCITQASPALTYQVLDGRPFLNAPDWRYTVSARQEFDVGEHRAHVQLGYVWQSKVNFDVSQDPLRVQKAYGIAEAAAGFTTGDGRFELSLFVNNLFDQQYRVGTITFNGTFAGNGPAYAQQIARDFRRYAGIRGQVNF